MYNKMTVSDKLPSQLSTNCHFKLSFMSHFDLSHTCHTCYPVIPVTPVTSNCHHGVSHNNKTVSTRVLKHTYKLKST